MKSDRLKQLLLNNEIEYIRVTIPKARLLIETTVIDLRFVAQTRKDFILTVSDQPKPRENRTKILTSYLLDFKKSYPIHVLHKESESVYRLSNDYSIENKELKLNAELM